MKNLRRSLNSNGHHGHGSNGGHASQPSAGAHHTNGPITPPGTVGPAASAFSNPLSRPTEKVAPPQKVIKALASHRSTNPQELSYTKGDFWYVTGEREGWYEALNPITGSRGLVPKSDFEEFVKGGRQASGPPGPPGQPGPPIPAQTPSPVAPTSDHVRSHSKTHSQTHSQSHSQGHHSAGGRSPTMAAPLASPSHKRPTQPLYAIVQYDFHAERPDELEAKAGEAIVVIAQSNHEWFVAKPIGRLGGPGLIPVAFVEIRDPVTGKPVDVFPSSIPQVEEWKKATAEYKAAAIPLGRFDLPPDQRVPNSPYAPAPPTQTGGQMESHDSQRTPTAPGRSTSPTSTSRGQLSRSESHLTASTGYRPEQDLMLPPGELVQLGVPSFHNESGNYWFRLHAAFMPDDKTQPAYTLILYRTYEDFYEFQITLLDTFPTEAGRPRPGEEDRSPPPRILPYMPGPVDEAIDDELTEYRRDELDAYVHALLDLRPQNSGYILRHELIRNFFAAKDGDYCEETSRSEAIEELQERMGDVSFESGPPSSAASANAVHHAPYGNRSDGLVHGGQQSQPSDQYGYGGHNRNPSANQSGPMAHEAQPSSHARTASNNAAPTLPALGSNNAGGGGSWATSPMAASNSAFANHAPVPAAASTLAPSSAIPPSAAHPRAAPAPGAAFIKIKIYDRATDDLIALRVHPAVTYAELLDKVRARLGPDVSVLQYRVGGANGPVMVGGSAPCRQIHDDRDLAEWMSIEDQKLVLYAEQ